MAKARKVLQLVLMKQLRNRECMMWQGRLGLAARARAPLPHRVLQPPAGHHRISQSPVVARGACLPPTFRSQRRLPRGLPPSTTSRTKGLSPQISWHNCTIAQFHNLTLIAFDAWSFGVLESLRPCSSSKDYALCATGAELTRPLRCPAAQAAARTRAAGW